jgi:hypothetical protein
MTFTRNESQNSLDTNRRCKRTASKIAKVKDGIENSQKSGYVMIVLMKKCIVINCSKII